MRSGYAQNHCVFALCSIFSVKILSEEYSLKKKRFKGEKKVLVCVAISYRGLRYLYFIEWKENNDVYE